MCIFSRRQKYEFTLTPKALLKSEKYNNYDIDNFGKVLFIVECIIDTLSVSGYTLLTICEPCARFATAWSTVRTEVMKGRTPAILSYNRSQTTLKTIWHFFLDVDFAL